jgi:hypothetical protein
MCQIWFKKIAIKDFGKMEAEEINIVIRKKLDETDEKDLLA